MTKKKAKAKHFVFLNLMKQKYHHKIVRDLAWCISSPELLNETLSFGDNIMKDYFLEFQEKLTKLDKNSLELETFLSHKNTLRLGHYYEALICFWLQNSIKFDLLANNVPLRNQEKITIGEVDLIVFNKITKDYEHWELAVKFYLAYIKKGQTDYIGPNANDHFHLKLAKLKNYQCKILETVPGKKYLSELNISKIKNKLLVKGLLCYHPNDIKKPWENISVQHAQSWWIYLEEAQEFLDDALSYFILDKKEWLSTPSLPKQQFNKKEFLNIIRQEFSHSQSSLFIVGYKKNTLKTKGFVVHTHWPNLYNKKATP